MACASPGEGPPRRVRRLAGAVLLAGVTVLALSWYLQPDPVGLGTHRQLGLPPCSMVALTGYPCPTCGMTTAFAHIVRGQLLSALRAHSGGTVLALAVLVAVLLSAKTLLTGRLPTLPNWLMRWDILLLIVAGLIVLGWAVKMAVLLIARNAGV